MPGACSFVPGAAEPRLPIGGGALRGFCIDWAIAGVKASSIKAGDTNRRRMVGLLWVFRSLLPSDRVRLARSSFLRARRTRSQDVVSQRKHVSDEIILFLLVQLEAEDQVEELDGVGE